MWCNHRLNMELDLQSSFGPHVTWCEQLVSLAETPQPPPLPPHLVSYTRGAIGQLVRRFGPLMSCADYKLSALTKDLASHGCQSESWKAQHINSVKQKIYKAKARCTLLIHPSITKMYRIERLGLYTLKSQNTEISKQIFPEKEFRGLSPNFHIHAPVIPRSVRLICWRKYVDRSRDY